MLHHFCWLSQVGHSGRVYREGASVMTRWDATCTGTHGLDTTKEGACCESTGTGASVMLHHHTPLLALTKLDMCMGVPEEGLLGCLDSIPPPFIGTR